MMNPDEIFEFSHNSCWRKSCRSSGLIILPLFLQLLLRGLFYLEKLPGKHCLLCHQLLLISVVSFTRDKGIFKESCISHGALLLSWP